MSVTDTSDSLFDILHDFGIECTQNGYTPQMAAPYERLIISKCKERHTLARNDEQVLLQTKNEK